MEILEQIRNANLKNISSLNVSFYPSMEYQIEVPRTNFDLGNKTLQYLKICDSNSAQNVLNSLMTAKLNAKIVSNEMEESEIDIDGVKYTKFTFSNIKDDKDKDASFAIMVRHSEKNVLIDYLFVDLEHLMANDRIRLSAKDISIVRQSIDKVNEDSKREELFLELQKKVTYHNQRDNEPDYVNNSKSQTDDNSKSTKLHTNYNADRMCNVTSLAMAFEMLGVSKEDAIAKLNEDGISTKDIEGKDFEDIIDFIRVKKAFSYTDDYGKQQEALDRTAVVFWEKVAEYLGITTECYNLNSSDINSSKWKTHKPKIEKALKEGDGVVLSLFRNAGHIVRLQGISNNGIIVDDPYGKLTNMAKREIRGTNTTGSYDANLRDMSLDGMKGEDVTITWDELNVGFDDNGCGGDEKVDGNKFWKDGIDTNTGDKIRYHMTDWAKVISPCEYVIEEKEEVDKDGNIHKSSLVRCHGGMVKYYVVFKKQ